jgi:predicted glycoside hydrolase/deacetylase ChbG (UPF0249 family)
MKGLFFLLITVCSVHASFAQARTTQERLGYSKDTKLLIIHSDDLAVAHAENSASFEAMTNGSVNSASIMIPCPWLTEVAAFAKQYPKADIGLHLTLTSEWKNYKWGPVSSIDKVPGLINANGYFYSSVDSVVMFAKPAEVEEEIRNQVKRSISMGIEPTHLDAHMGATFASLEFLKTYIKVGKEFNLPVMLHRGMGSSYNVKMDSLAGYNAVFADDIISASPADFKVGMKKYYTGVFNNLKPGLNCLLIHTAYDNDEMQAITTAHPDWGAAWRQQDFEFFTSSACQKLLADNKIVLITWREIRDKLYKGR